ncbi:alpha-glucan family phosphorylase [bacterium]|nr:alpha-glucan family phosphorylase [bacterium]
MKPSFVYVIRPRLPEKLNFLAELGRNLWWTWNFEAGELFRRIDPQLWEQLGQNPVLLLGRVRQERLLALAEDEGYLASIERVQRNLHEHLTSPRWFQRHYPNVHDLQVAYFSAEFGLAGCLPIYSGGLGILAGDHLKTASDMGLPLVAVGLAYRQGYFHQYLNVDGWQQERYDENDFVNMPIQQVRDAQEEPLVISVPYCSALGSERHVAASIWRVQVGRIPLYLLNTNLPQNAADDRALTNQLYGGDLAMRIRQEILLGIGGSLMLQALGLRPSVCHMNEGHSAFLPLERARQLMREQGLPLQAALEASCSGNVFTTHTPVPAGNDRFDDALLKRYLGPFAESLGSSWEDFAALGRDPAGEPRSFCMTVSALRTATFSNAVARLHAVTSRGMWHGLWPGLPQDEVPIGPVTNGIHLYSWLSRDMADLFNRYLDPAWRSDPITPGIWNRISEIPDEELWRTHESRRAQLVAFARRRLAAQVMRRGAAPDEAQAAAEVLNPEALTIGFGRRFATYKRATLLLRDISRLKQMLSNREMPVQIIFAGKAHPRDDEGKRFIREIIHAVRDEGLRSRIVFLEDYDITVARHMVQGCDVWLNTPRRPLEASGTSGMKAVANGGLHLSTLDGWWDQAYDPAYGWAIGNGETYDDSAYQDRIEGDALYELIEQDVIPLFYRRNSAGLPRDWVARMKRSMSSLIPRFTSHRMLRNYIEEAYVPAHSRYQALARDNFAGAQELAQWRSRIKAAWPGVRVLSLEVGGAGLNGAHVSSGDEGGSGSLTVGEEISVSVSIDPAGLSAEDLLVEVYRGPVNADGFFSNGAGQSMQFQDEYQNGSDSSRVLRYSTMLASSQSGLYGFTVRVFPRHTMLAGKYSSFMVTWSDDSGAVELPAEVQSPAGL